MEKKIFYKSIVENENLISKAIDHYTSIWPKKKKRKMPWRFNS